MLDILERTDLHVLTLDREASTLRMATAPLFLYVSQYLGAENMVRVSG